MPGTSRRERPALITSARPGRSLDSAARNRRYLITMGIRLACFALAIAIDGWLRWVFLIAAAVLPAVAVLLANASDLRRPDVSSAPNDAGERPQLVSPGTVPGRVEP
jgi:hypothetical protein